MKGHGVSPKTVRVRAYAVNVKFTPRKILFCSYNMSQVQRATEAKQFELGSPKSVQD